VFIHAPSTSIAEATKQVLPIIAYMSISYLPAPCPEKQADALAAMTIKALWSDELPGRPPERASGPDGRSGKRGLVVDLTMTRPEESGEKL
jgi:hypothetical protein